MKSLFLPIIVSMLLIILCFVCFGGIETLFLDFLKAAQNDIKTYCLLSWSILTSDIVLPVPSSVVMYLNGYVLGWFYGSLLSWISVMLSALIGYYMGYYSAKRWSPVPQERVQRWIERYGIWSLLLTRGIPVLSESVCLTAGFNRMNIKSYVIWNGIGYLPISLMYGWCGHFGKTQAIFLYTFGVSILLSGVCWLIGQYWTRKSAI
ncbi:MAG: hypothetical protein RIS64_2362 [Bacteroidota bacterium]